MDTKQTFEQILEEEIALINTQDNSLINELFAEISPALKKRNTHTYVSGSSIFIYAHVSIKVYLSNSVICVKVKPNDAESFTRMKKETFDSKESALRFIAQKIAYNYSESNQQQEVVPSRI